MRHGGRAAPRRRGDFGGAAGTGPVHAPVPFGSAPVPQMVVPIRRRRRATGETAFAGARVTPPAPAAPPGAPAESPGGHRHAARAKIARDVSARPAGCGTRMPSRTGTDAAEGGSCPKTARFRGTSKYSNPPCVPRSCPPPSKPHPPTVRSGGRRARAPRFPPGLVPAWRGPLSGGLPRVPHASLGGAVLCRTTRCVASSMRWAAVPGSSGRSSIRAASSAMCRSGWWTVVSGGLDHCASGTSS